MNTRAKNVWYELRGIEERIRDVFRLLTFKFRRPRSGTKFWMLDRLRRLSNATRLIETGTYRGDTAYRAASSFRSVETIEIDPALAQAATRRLAHLKNVTVHEGDAVALLGELLAAGDAADTLLFLDAHFSGGETSFGDTPEPAIEELEVAAEYRDKLAAVVIDDFRSFGVQPDFPTKSQVFSAIEKLFPEEDFDVTVHLDAILVLRAGHWF